MRGNFSAKPRKDRQTWLMDRAIDLADTIDQHRLFLIRTVLFRGRKVRIKIHLVPALALPEVTVPDTWFRAAYYTWGKNHGVKVVRDRKAVLERACWILRDRHKIRESQFIFSWKIAEVEISTLNEIDQYLLDRYSSVRNPGLPMGELEGRFGDRSEIDKALMAADYWGFKISYNGQKGKIIQGLGRKRTHRPLVVDLVLSLLLDESPEYLSGILKKNYKFAYIKSWFNRLIGENSTYNIHTWLREVYIKCSVTDNYSTKQSLRRSELCNRLGPTPLFSTSVFK